MVKKIVLILMALTSVSAIAGEQVWDFGKLNTNGVKNGNELTYHSNGNFSVTVSAWSSTGNGCETVNGNDKNDKKSCIQSAKLKSYNGGLGVLNRKENDDEPNHAIDNIKSKRNDLDVDMVMLTFEHEVQITGFGTGWNASDSDASVVAYEGDNLAGFGKNNWSQILSNGWSVVDNKAGNDYSTNNGNLKTFGVEDKAIYSKNWLVGAYSVAFGASNWSDTDDAFKLNGITAVKRDELAAVTVSAPATIGIFALFGLLIAYRRK